MFSLYSDSGFGGYNSSSSKRDYESTEPQKKVDLDGLIPFEKNFYVESPNIANMSESEVEEYRKKREITVEGRDVPKPIKTFADARFPGNKHALFMVFLKTFSVKAHDSVEWLLVVVFCIDSRFRDLL